VQARSWVRLRAMMMMSVAEVLSGLRWGGTPCVGRLRPQSRSRGTCRLVIHRSGSLQLPRNNRTDIHWSSRRSGIKSCCLRCEGLLITNDIFKTMRLSKNKNLHRPLRSALNDSGNVFDVRTFAQVDDFQCRRHHQADKPSVGDGGRQHIQPAVTVELFRSTSRNDRQRRRVEASS
jgi:hypothetical protein